MPFKIQYAKLHFVEFFHLFIIIVTSQTLNNESERKEVLNNAHENWAALLLCGP